MCGKMGQRIRKVTKKKLGESRNFQTKGNNIGDGTKMFKVINKREYFKD